MMDFILLLFSQIAFVLRVFQTLSTSGEDGPSSHLLSNGPTCGNFSFHPFLYPLLPYKILLLLVQYGEGPLLIHLRPTTISAAAEPYLTLYLPPDVLPTLPSSHRLSGTFGLGELFVFISPPRPAFGAAISVVPEGVLPAVPAHIWSLLRRLSSVFTTKTRKHINKAFSKMYGKFLLSNKVKNAISPHLETSTQKQATSGYSNTVIELCIVTRHINTFILR